MLQVAQRRVFGPHAAVDDAYDEVLAVQPQRAAQALVFFEKPEELEAVRRGQGTNFILPYVQYLGQAGELVRLGGMHAGGKPVEPEAIAVDKLGIGARSRDYPVLRLLQSRGIPLDSGIRLVEAHPGYGTAGLRHIELRGVVLRG